MTDADHHVFEQVLVETLQRIPLRILAYCVMTTHWHFVAWPRLTGELSSFLHLLTTTHARRWHEMHDTRGTGALYQSRFKSFPVQDDEHVFRVCRYVERNPLRANMVARAEDYRWSSLWHRLHGDPLRLLCEPPAPLPRDWLEIVNTPETDAEVAALRRCSRRGAPLGSPEWTAATARRWGLEHALRPVGRPRKTILAPDDAASATEAPPA